MKKYSVKMLSVLMAFILMLTTLFSIDTGIVFAATSGNCGASGSNATYSFDESTGTLTITGTGATADYRNVGSGRAPWYTYKSNIRRIVIGEGITIIGNYNFYDCQACTYVSLPSTLTELKGNATGYGCFRECTALETITLPQSLRSIGQSVFHGCTSLKSITIPDSVTSMGVSAFYGCTALTTVNFGSGLTSVPTTAFSSSGVKKVNWGGVQTIGTSAFYECNFTAVDLPETVTSVGTAAFQQNTFLSSVTINNANATLTGNFCSGSQQSITIYGHSGSTAESFANSYNYAFVSLDACSHDETHIVTVREPTCTETGLEQMVCDLCEQVVSETTVPALGHDWGEPDETVDNTDVDGHVYNTYTCSICGDTLDEAVHQRTGFEGIDIENLSLSDLANLDASLLDRTIYIWIDGTYTKTVVRAAVCTSRLPGREQYECNICGQTETHYVLPTHNVASWNVTKAATCTENGEKSGICTVCGETVTETIAARGHNYDMENPYRVYDSEEDGHTHTEYICANCDEVVTEYVHNEWIEGLFTRTVLKSERDCTLPALQTDVCDICGERNITTVAGNEEHDLYETTRTAPTCTARGTINYACYECSHTEVEYIDSLGHDYVLQSELCREPTCTENGLNSYLCSRCSMTTSEVIPKTGHKAQLGTRKVVTQPACETTGLATATCSVCGENYEETLEALGHEYENIETEIDEAEDMPGHVLSTPTCIRCSRTQPGSIVHKEWIEGYYTISENSTPATCTVGAQGLKRCTKCSQSELVETAPPRGHLWVYNGNQTAEGLSFRCSHCFRTTETPIPASELLNIWAGGIYAGYAPERTGTNDSSYLDVNGDGIINGRDYANIRILIMNEKNLIAEAEEQQEEETTQGEE